MFTTGKPGLMKSKHTGGVNYRSRLELFYLFIITKNSPEETWSSFCLRAIETLCRSKPQTPEKLNEVWGDEK